MLFNKPMFVTNNPSPPPETENPYLTFSSPSSFTLQTGRQKAPWDGIIEYSTDKETWNTWSGSVISAGLYNDKYVIYLRGTGNTYITSDQSTPTTRNTTWVLNGSNISCIGNIENLLDYETVLNGNHPTMARWCYYSLFHNCTALISPPELPAISLSDNCYEDMFDGCTSLTSLPNLPATNLIWGCYQYMFYNCSSIKVSETQSEDCIYPYRIPTEGSGVIGISSLSYMFTGTGGTFTGTPSINTTYYTNHEPV